jgi:DNA-binding SARP family transcriptional activator
LQYGCIPAAPREGRFDAERRRGRWWRVKAGVLGPLVVVDDAGGELTLPVRLRTLLAALLLHANQAVTVGQLAEIVWDGEPTNEALRTLPTYIARLRRALGPKAGARIETQYPGYLCRVSQDELDALRFEALCGEASAALQAGEWAAASDAAAGALALWRGAPLLDVPSQVLLNEFVPRLERLRLQALEDHAEAQLQLGQHEQLVPQLRELTGTHPLRERFHAQLMLALARAGRQAEALEAYQQARRVLVEQLGVEPGSQLRDLNQRILAEDAGILAASGAGATTGAHKATAAAPSAVAVPRWLPAAAGHFTGRHAELDALTSQLERDGQGGGTVVISAIDGMAGIGKTALAVHAARRLADRFPDGQLFVDLHGYTKGYPPRTPGQALEVFLRALGVPAQQIPAALEESSALYRQRLADTRTLIVLDNATDETQVRPLLPGTPGCLVLVTSRKRLKGLDDAYSLSLELLPSQDAVALLRAVAGPDRVSADDPLLGEVAQLCGNLPLALRIAGALLRHRSAWSLGYLAGLLRDQHRRVRALSDGERDLGAVFDLSYTGLDEQHQLLFRRLALVPGPDADAYAAAALLDTDPTAADGLLQDLVDHNLLIEHAAGRYRLHDLIRAYTHALADEDPADDNRAALDRLLHYYAYTAQSASIPVSRYPRPEPDGPAPAHTPVLPDTDVARSWLRSERPGLEAAFAHARTHGLDEHAIALAAGLAEVLQADGPFTDAIEIHQAAAETAERLHRPAAHANALTELGRMRSMTGDYPSAVDAHARALEIYRTLGNRHGEANALTDLGHMRQVIGDYPAADEAHTQALEIYRTLGNRLGEATALNDLGRLRYVTGDYPGADEAHTRALQIYRTLENPLGEARVLNELGRVRSLMGDYLGADAAHTRALEIYRALDNPLGEANALTNAGRVRYQTEDYPGADEAFSRALEIFLALDHELGEAYARTNLGRVQHATGDFAGAVEALTRVLEIYRELGDRGNQAWALNYYAAAVAANGQRARGLALYQQALAMNRELNKPDDEAVSLEGIAEHYLAADDPVQGTENLQQALEIYERLGMKPDAARVRGRLALIATE